jgi:hypothetical protein
VSTLRKVLVVLGLTTAIAAGTVAAPAIASLADSAVVSTTIATNAVAAPTNFTGNLVCTEPATMSATWTKSTSARVTGYDLKVYFSDGYVQTVQLPGTATSWSASIAKYNVTYWAVQYSVTTKTDYGWTKESAKTAAFQC